jgi:hypothetical protein
MIYKELNCVFYTTVHEQENVLQLKTSSFKQIYALVQYKSNNRAV